MTAGKVGTGHAAGGETKCKSCGRTIYFVPTDKRREDGSAVQIPLERIAQVYVIAVDGRAQRVLASEPFVYVSHFATCPDAKRYSRRTPAS